jgi:hypothetical protein
MDTNLSLNQIECALAKYFNVQKNIIVCNVSYGFLPYEADMIVMSKSGYLTEIEIKRSYSDFCADFKKDAIAHNSEYIKEFYYAVPKEIAKKCVSTYCKCHGIKDLDIGNTGVHPAHFITYDENGVVRVLGVGSTGNNRKLYLEEQLSIARLGAMRVWKYKFIKG